jgi:hypothetical protein
MPLTAELDGGKKLRLVTRWSSFVVVVVGFVFVVYAYAPYAKQDATETTRKKALSLGLMLEEFEGPVVRTYDYFGSKEYSWTKKNDDLGSFDYLTYDPYENRVCWTKKVAERVLHTGCIVAKDEY